MTQIWDRLYELYIEQANGTRDGAVIQAEIDDLIRQRNEIRAWGWNTGRNWKDDIPKDIAEKLLRE
ncbi:MAG: hypothetical protein ACM3JG_06745 [Thiohalocapsa sp.]